MRRPRRVVMLMLAACSLGAAAIPAQSQTGPVETRLQALEDKEQIAQLLIDYGRYLDSRDLAAYAALFALVARRAHAIAEGQPAHPPRHHAARPEAR